MKTLALITLLLFPAHLVAAPNPGFEIPRGLEGAVEFWILIFTEYGKEQVVFHHRDKPEIIYSVLDFSELRGTISDAAYDKQRDKMVRAEGDKIRAALKRLSRGNAPQNEFEAHIKEVVEKGSSYREALGHKMVRGQSGIKEKFEDAIIRSGRYMSAIEDIFRSEGLPIELTRLPFVESSFNYEAYSSVGAAGLWQFIRSTGKRYLRINNSIDERRDAISASRAAAKYLKRNYEMLGTWPLAVTAYNHGAGGMSRAVKQLGTKDIKTIIDKYDGRTFGFASKNFYVELLAANIVYDNRGHYFPNALPEPPLRFDEVLLERPVYISEIKSATSVREEELKKLNYGFTDRIWKNRSPVPRGVFLKVPEGQGIRIANLGDKIDLVESTEVYANKLGDIQKANQGGVHVVRKGETLSGIASRYGTSISAIKNNNRIGKRNLIYVGQRLRVPGAGEGSVPAPRKASAIHVVRKGETLSGISSKYGVRIGDLASANQMSSKSMLRIGQKLKVPGAGGKTHKVTTGENLGKIARKYGVSLESLIARNNISNPALLRVGQELQIP